MKTFLNFIKQVVLNYKLLKKSTIDIINRYYQFLDSGIYKTNRTNTLIYNYKFKLDALFENNFIWKENCKKSIKKDKTISLATRVSLWLFSVFFRISVDPILSNKSIDKCHCIIISTLKQDTKIINYFDNTIYTMFKDKNRMDSIIKLRDQWSQKGNVVPIVEMDYERLFIKEELIKKLPYNHNCGFDFILSDITHMFENKSMISQPYLCTQQELDRIKTYLCSFNNDNAKQLLNSFEFFNNKSYYKKCICHGDLYYNNLIFDGNNYFYIDFECLGNHFFLFDVLFYIFFESFRFNNDSLIKNYLNGEYDKQLTHIFDLNGVPYLKNLKKTYLFITLFEYYKEKIPHRFLMPFCF